MLPWFKWWRFAAPPKDFLPENGLGGMMVYAGGMDVCAGFLYFTNSKTAWIEFIVSNPNLKDREKRTEAIQILLSELCLLAASKGYKYIFTSVKHEGLINHLLKAGFQKGSTNTTEMFIVLK